MRAKNAPMIISFLYREFKDKNILTIPNHKLVNDLSYYLESIDYLDEDNQYPDFQERAKKYIDDWCNDLNQYLRKFPDEKGMSVHELTSDTEKVFQWIASLEKKEFIGTESRFLDIFSKLRDLIEHCTAEPEKRIEDLEKKKQEIESHIRQIQMSGKLDVFSDTQIKERFYEINKLGRELIADFKEVEQNFKDIKNNVQNNYIKKEALKGEILKYTLDAIDELGESDQGKSFYAFWNFLIADHKQDELQKLTKDVYTILEQRNIYDYNSFLRDIKIYLHRAGQRVMDSNHLLLAQLRRILDKNFLFERKKTIKLITEIRKYAIEHINNPPELSPFIEIEGNCDISMVMDRPLGELARSSAFCNHPVEMDRENSENKDLTELFSQFEIDREILQENINYFFQDQDQVSLETIIKHFPLQKGLAEITAYLSIATDSPIHMINCEKNIEITWNHEGICEIIRLPQVIFQNNKVET